jgi:biopolymer transport protein ExbB
MESSFNPIAMWHHMGWIDKSVVSLLILMSNYSLWVMIDRFAVFSKAKRYSISFVLALRDRMGKRDLNGALNLSKAEPQSPIAKVIYEALTEYRDGLDAIAKTGPDEVGEFDVVDAVNRAIDRVKEREIANMKKGLGGLASISSAAPFIGLFGTVIGIIHSFQTMAASGQGGLGAVSAGISEALVTTAAGLLVAIPAVMAFNYFTNTIEQFVVDMNDVSSELISYVLREGRER